MMKPKRPRSIKIKSVEPGIILKGGIVDALTEGKLPAWELDDQHVLLNGNSMRLIGASSDRLFAEIIYVSEDSEEVPFSIKIEGVESNVKTLYVPKKISSNHVFGTSPICDLHGNIYFVDLKELQDNKQSIVYKYLRDQAKVQAFITDVTAPTSLAHFEGVLYVTSMVERKLYRCVGQGECEVFSQGLGSVFGLAINALGEIFVGDQTGSLFKVDSTGRAAFFASLPETFKGYHFVFAPDNTLYISVPSSVGKNCIYRLDQKNEPEIFLETMNILGGVAFAPDGLFYWVENNRDEGAVYRINIEGVKEKIVSGSFILGLTFTPQGDMVMTDLHNIYLIPQKWLEN